MSKCRHHRYVTWMHCIPWQTHAMYTNFRALVLVRLCVINDIWKSGSSSKWNTFLSEMAEVSKVKTRMRCEQNTMIDRTSQRNRGMNRILKQKSRKKILKKKSLENKAIDALSLDLPMARNAHSSFSIDLLRPSVCGYGCICVCVVCAWLLSACTFSCSSASHEMPTFIHTILLWAKLTLTLYGLRMMKNIVIFVIGWKACNSKILYYEQK